MRFVSLFVASIVVTACGTVLEAAPVDDAGTDGGSSGASSSSGGSGGDGGAESGPKSGCAAQTSFVLCSDFDVSADVQQETEPGAVKWLVEKDAEDLLTIDSSGGFSGKNALRSGGDGTKAPVRAQVVRDGFAAPKTSATLSFALRLDALPTTGGGDIFFATLGFSNVRFAAVMHADGTLDLAQLAPPTSTSPVKTNMPTPAVTTKVWSTVAITVNRATGKVGVSLNGKGTTVPMIEADLGNSMNVAVGIGYCDVSCGTPSFLFDDVVLVAE